MKLKPDFNKILKALLAWLYRLRALIAIVVIIGLVGYGAYLVNQVVQLQPDAAYLASKRQDLDKSKIVFDKKTIAAINNLKQTSPTIDLSDLGKSDPFSP